MFENQIIDGYHRYIAAKAAGAEPVFIEWTGTQEDARRFVVYSNGTRRHLSKAAHAQALMRADIMGSKTIEEIASTVGAGIWEVHDQKQLRQKDPAEADRVAAGKVPAQVAVRKVLNKRNRAQRESYPHILNGTLTRRMYSVLDGTGMTESRFINEAVADKIAAWEKREVER